MTETFLTVLPFHIYVVFCRKPAILLSGRQGIARDVCRKSGEVQRSGGEVGVGDGEGVTSLPYLCGGSARDLMINQMRGGKQQAAW